MAITTVPAAAVITSETSRAPYLEWGPVILGALGATAISVVLLTFGAALGLSVVSPYPYAGISARGLAVLAGTYAALVAVASFAAGGYLAGRLRSPWSPGERAASELVETQFRDGAHGFGVWALAVLLGAALAVSGAGAALKTAVQATTAVAAAGAAGAAANPAAVQALSTTPTDYAVDRLLAPAPAPAGTNAPAQPAPRAALAAPIARAFAANLGNPQLDARDRATLAQIVVQQTGMPQAEAEKRVDDAFAELKAAEQKARDAAEKARKAVLIAAFLAAATLAIGCAAACAAAAVGARHRDERIVVGLFGSPRFW